MCHSFRMPEMSIFSVETQVLLDWPASMSANDRSGPVSEAILASGQSLEEDFARATTIMVSHSGDYQELLGNFSRMMIFTFPVPNMPASQKLLLCAQDVVSHISRPAWDHSFFFGGGVPDPSTPTPSPTVPSNGREGANHKETEHDCSPPTCPSRSLRLGQLNSRSHQVAAKRFHG